MEHGIICQACGIEAPTRPVQFYQNIGAVVVRFHKRVNGNLCKRCVHKFFWQFTGTTLAIGWLGTISIIVAPIFVINNIVRYLAALPMPGVPMGATVPMLSDEVVKKLSPKIGPIFARLNSGEKLAPVAREVASQTGVTPGQVVMFVTRVAQQSRARAAAPTPTGGFPVLPPKPVPAIPLPPIPLEA